MGCTSQFTRISTLLTRIGALLCIMGISLSTSTKSIFASSKSAPIMHDTVYLFSHGLADTGKQAKVYLQYPSLKEHENERYILGHPCYTFDYPDATDKFWRIKWWKTCFGQESELVPLHKAYTKAMQNTHTSPRVVLFGLSRGASAIFSFIAQYDPPDIAAVILESPFSSIEDLGHLILQRLFPWATPGKRTAMGVLAQMAFWGYRPGGIAPIRVAHKIPLDMPILMICSEEDTVVPAKSTEKLYQELIKLGHRNTHILKLAKGKHSKILQQSNGEIYRNVVHAFYSTYGLPHDPAYAAAGMSNFEKTHPFFEEKNTK